MNGSIKLGNRPANYSDHAIEDDDRPARAIQRPTFWLFSAVGTYFAIYCAQFIWRTSAEVGGQRYFVLFDDAMISMRYAHNLAAGYGLVWNPGEVPVEGYTNLLWTLYMALWHLLPIPASLMSLPIQVTSAVLLAGSLVFVYRIARLLVPGTWAVSACALILAAAYTPTINWGLQGMEVGAITLVVTWATWLLVKDLTAGVASPYPYLILGIGALIRLDAAVVIAAVLVFMLVAQPQERKRHILFGMGTLILSVGSQTIFRLLCYGDYVPNTYHLKMEGFPVIDRISRGAHVLYKLALDMTPALFVLPFAAPFLARDKRVWLLTWLLCVHMAYSVYVGGDAWEFWGGANRYISPAMPLFIVLACITVNRLAAALVSVLRQRERFHAALLAAFVALALILLNWVPDSFENSDYTDFSSNWGLLRGPLGSPQEREQIALALALKDSTVPQAHIAVVWAGTIPYFSERPAIDLLGKNDPVIAHMPAIRYISDDPETDFWPGHMKYNYTYSVGQLRPDIVAQLWGVVGNLPAEQLPESMRPYFATAYRITPIGGSPVYVRRDSPYVLQDGDGSSGR